MNNKGFSLVEMIVVVVIIGIASAGVMLGFGEINKQHSDEGLKALASSLDSARYQALSVENSEFYIYVDNGYYCSCLYNGDTKEKETEKLFSDNFSIIIQNNDKVATVTSEDTFIESDLDFLPLLKITFDKSTGKLKEIKTKDDSFIDMATITTTNGNVILKITKNGRIRVE